jgi:hypothetical protein
MNKRPLILIFSLVMLLALPFSVSAMSNPQTVRQRIVDKLKLRLAAILIVNGYQTDIGANGGNPIDEWPTQFQEEELAVATRLGIFDLVASKPQTEYNELQVLNTLPMQVRIYHKRGTTPAELRVMLGDVQRGLITDPDTGKEDPGLGGIAVHMFSSESGFVVPKETFQIDGAAVGFDVLYLTKPFSEIE